MRIGHLNETTKNTYSVPKIVLSLPFQARVTYATRKGQIPPTINMYMEIYPKNQKMALLENQKLKQSKYKIQKKN